MTDSTREGLPLRRIFVADLGGTHLRSAVVDQDGKIRLRLKQKTPRASEPEEIVAAMVTAFRECEQQLTDSPIDFVSVVVPGTVHVGAGSIVRVPNVRCLDGFDLTAALENALQRPAILENDANAAAVGEMWQGAARGQSTIVCVTLGTGVGGGIILDGSLWHGVNDSAAEIGHMCVESFGNVACACGSRGCLEVYASATAVVRMAHEGRARHPGSVLNSVAELTAEELYRAGTQGDELALAVFHRMGFYLGIGLANVINMLNPAMIVIGGGVSNAWDLFEKDMRHQIYEHAFPLPAAEVKIVPAQCGDDAGLLGAARLALCSN